MCLPQSILQQVLHHKHAYTPDMAFRQVAFHMLRNPLKFYKYMEQEFAETGESYESYVTNIFRGKVWGDDLIVAAFGDMWNIAVSVVSPAYTKPQPLFHNKPKPDIVIVANGSCWRNGADRTTHFSATSCYDKSYKVPGTEYSNPVIAMDKVPNTDPIILSDKNKASQVAVKEYLRSAEDMSLDLLRGVSLSINRLNGKIADIVSQVDALNEEKKVLEYRLNRLGVAADRIKEAGQIEETQYCRTGEREKIDAEHAKRKREQEELEEEERKKIRIIPTVDGKYRRSYEIEGQEVEAEDMEEITESANEKYLKKLVQQQKEKIQNQEFMLLQQGQEIEFQASNIRMLKEEREKKSNMSKEEKEKKKTNIKEEVIDVDESTVKDEAKQSTSSAKSGKIEDMVRKELLQFLPKYQSGLGTSSTTEKEGSSTDTTSSQVKPDVNVYVREDEQPAENVILVKEAVQKKVPERRAGKTRPKPKAIREKHKYYCEDCKSEFSRKDQLAQHVKNDCNQPIRQFICNKCNEGYYSERAVREHYYQVHLQEYLYFCKQCGKGFYHISRKSLHKDKCPNKGGPDKFQGKAPLREELEASFKRRTIMPLCVAKPEVATPETQQNFGNVQPDAPKEKVEQDQVTENPDDDDDYELVQPQPQETGVQAGNIEEKIEFDLDTLMEQDVEKQEQEVQQPVFPVDDGMFAANDVNLIDQETENATGLLMAMAQGRLLGAQNVEGAADDDEGEIEDNLV